MQTRSSVLGKRQSSPEVVASPSTPSKASAANRRANVLPTPETTPNAKRMKLSETVCDGHNNKENIPPLRHEAINLLASPTRNRRAARSNSTDQLFSSRRESSLRRYASLSQLPVTPSHALSHISLATPPPTPPSALQPIASRVRALLRPTCNGSASMSGRESERSSITRFVSSFLREPSSAPEHSILYISGSPGTGKTALVNALLGDMRDDLSDAAVTVITVNCMALNSMEALLERLIEEFGRIQKPTTKAGKLRKTKETALQSLDTLLRGATRRSIVLLDELDHVASSTSSLTTLFTLVHSHYSILRAIGIANTHTLSTTAAATSMSAMTLKGVQTLHFAPYTPQQLLEIIHARFTPLTDIESTDECRDELVKLLPTPTLLLLTKKVAALTGDVRALLEVLRCAINIALNAAPPVPAANPLDAPTPAVMPAHVLEALKAYSPSSSTSRAVVNSTAAVPLKTNNSEVVAKIQELGLQPRLALMSIVLARKRLESHLSLSGSSAAPVVPSPRPLKRTASCTRLTSPSLNIDVATLYAYYKSVLSRSEGGVFAPVSRSEFGDLVGMLETVGLVEMPASSSSPLSPSKSKKRSLSRTASFSAGASTGTQDVQLVAGVRMEEVHKALGIDATSSNDSGDVMAEEVRAIWEKERIRISRESKARSSSSTVAAAFDAALED